MIKVTIGNNVKRESVIIDENTTLRSALEAMAAAKPVIVAGNEGYIGLFTKDKLELAREKEEAGAAGFLTQPVHSPRALDNLARAREALNGYILGGVFPIVSHRNALFLNNEVAGVSVPEEIVARYEGLDREAALANMRFRFIESLCAETVVRPRESREHKRSMIIDRVLTGKYTAIPCFVRASIRS